MKILIDKNGGFGIDTNGEWYVVQHARETKRILTEKHA